MTSFSAESDKTYYDTIYVNSYEIGFPCEVPNMSHDIIIKVDGKLCKFTRSCMDSIKNYIDNVGRKLHFDTKDDFFGTYILFNDYIMPSVQDMIINKSSQNKILIQSINRLLFYNACKDILGASYRKCLDYMCSLSGLFNYCTDRIICETFGTKKSLEADTDALKKVMKHFAIDYKNEVCVSLIMTRIVDNIISGYTSRETIVLFGHTIHGHLRNVIIFGNNPFREMVDDINDIDSADEFIDLDDIAYAVSTSTVAPTI